ncbi:MAG: serine/threonine protein kinase [Chitinivibrionales bacterium]|nr:serine/threonine protein kinase [Chitinivibrionales bacterium]
MLFRYPLSSGIPTVGDTIGDCTILDTIAEGGMSYIFKVRNEKLEVIRVIKLIKSVEDIDLDRFKTEARISANLNHPNIVQCYSFGHDEHTSYPYIEMEYVDGTNLHQLIKTFGPMPVIVVCAVALFVCKALEAVHTCQYTLYEKPRKGIVHRDIKPANILIAHNGTIKLADFGIAKPKELSIHTAGFQIVGSPFYLSPEQLKKEDLDFRTDIYSFGCVLYEMVTGNRAFTQNNISDLAIAKNDGNFDANSLRSLPEKIRSLIIKCMKPDKFDRFNSITEICAVIDAQMKSFTDASAEKIIQEYLQEPFKFHVSGHSTKKSFITLQRFLIGVISLSTLCFIIIMALIISSPRHKKQVSSLKTTPALEHRDSSTQTLLLTPRLSTERASQVPMLPPSLPSPKLTVSQQRTTAQASAKTNSPSSTTGYRLKNTRGEPSFASDFLALFLSSNYEQCLKVLSPISLESLTDKQFLCLGGSLLGTKSFEQFINVMKSRTVPQDGYYYYLQGRIEILRSNYPEASNSLYSALAKPSFNPRLPFLASYHQAKTRFQIYSQKPNIENKNAMRNSFEQFILRYCLEKNSDECKDISRLMEENN